MIAEKTSNGETRGSHTEADILITGIENSQWISEQFAVDLRRLFPKLKIQAVSTNELLTAARDGIIPEVGKETIVLSVSQSGQTFPSLNATIALQHLIPGRVFALTGEIDTLMGAAVGQMYYKGASFNRRIFTNGSGRRRQSPRPWQVPPCIRPSRKSSCTWRKKCPRRQAFPNLLECRTRPKRSAIFQTSART